MLPDDHFDEFAHRTFRFPDFLADLVMQIQRDFAGYALCFHAYRSFFVLSLSGNTSILQPAG